MRLICVCLWALMSLPGGAAGASESPMEESTEWLAVLMNGNRAGHLRLSRQVFPDRVVTSEVSHLELERGGTPIVIRSQETYTESREGRPLSFHALQQVSGAEMEIEGRIDSEGMVHVTTRSAGSVQSQQFPWEDGVLMAEGSRLLLAANGLAPGREIELRVFVPSSLQIADATMRIEQTERVDLFGVEQDLIRVTETISLGNTNAPMVAWMNEALEVKKTRMTMMGLTFEAIACPEQCATADIEPTEFFATALSHSPRSLSAAMRENALTYSIRARDVARPLFFPESEEQLVRNDSAGVYRISIGSPAPEPDSHSPAADVESFLKATRWLQIDEPGIQRLARQARGDAQGGHATMLRLEAFVRDYVNDKNLSVGYASALEVARNRSGDCTEHALLLAALGRASGIPTRVATGLAYVDHWLGMEDVFVPHAWTQALIDGRWRSYDAALGTFDSGHIALGYGDGEPWGFYDGVNTLGNLEIVAIEASAD